MSLLLRARYYLLPLRLRLALMLLVEGFRHYYYASRHYPQ